MSVNFLRSFTICLFLLAFCANAFGASQWQLLYKGKESDVYYNKDSVKKVDAKIIEVYDAGVTSKGKTVRQLRINCETKMYALGLSDVYVGSRNVQSFDWSKNGWVWLSPKNSDVALKKLMGIVCKKNN